ncbi:MAG: tRNA (N(6)-L-threonylcarbamoyladenosine(37)-C(2))-methylthiotransferase MtaB, partial [Eggerthellaceae bacterium]
MTFSIITLGCKVNSCESAAIHAAFLAAGYSPAEEDSHADVYIINSCAVTSVGVKKARQTVSHCKTLNPDGITVLCGCYPQAYPEDAVRDVSAADIITGNANKSEIPV